MKVLQISAKDTYLIRKQMLREDHDLESVKFEGDENEQTFHLGAFYNNKLVSVASFYFNRNENFKEDYQYQLRGMATLPEFQRKGFSSELLNVGFPIVKQNFCQLIWCNARQSARTFYEKVGMEMVKGPYDIPTVGPHYLMVKFFK